MAVEDRPTDLITKENVFIGLPIVLFERLISPGVYDVPRNLGVIDSAELAKVVEVAQLPDRSSGIQSIQRESVRVLEPSLNVGLFNFEPENMRLFMSSASFVTAASTVVPITDDEYRVPDSFDKFGVLSNRNLTTQPLTDLDPKEITLEAVGTGDGTSGETLGDFALDFPIAALGDITVFTVGGVSRLGQLEDAGSPTTADDIAVIVGAVGVTGGQLDFGANEVPANGDAIVATYTPSFSFTDLTEYQIDAHEGRLRMLASSDKVRAGQILLADYSYTRADETQLKPFTQPNFEGRATIKQLTDDMGINFIWDVPLVSIRINDEAFAWSAEEFAAGSLTMTMLKDTTAPTAPYGILRLFPEQ